MSCCVETPFPVAAKPSAANMLYPSGLHEWLRIYLRRRSWADLTRLLPWRGSGASVGGCGNPQHRRGWASSPSLLPRKFSGTWPVGPSRYTLSRLSPMLLPSARMIYPAPTRKLSGRPRPRPIESAPSCVDVERRSGFFIKASFSLRRIHSSPQLASQRSCVWVPSEQLQVGRFHLTQVARNGN